MTDVHWERYPLVASQSYARAWLTIQAQLGLAPNTVAAYGRGLEEYLHYCDDLNLAPEAATRATIAGYVQSMATRPSSHTGRIGLANATMQQRLTAIRLYYDYLVEEEVRTHNPVKRGQYIPGRAFGGARERGLIPHYRKLPWIPTDEEWQTILETALHESLRNRLMLALAYDGALRREELCALATGDIDPAHRLLNIRAETTKTRQGRVVPYSVVSADLLAAYLRQRRAISQNRGPLFLSTSRRNYGQPITIWTWSKVVRKLALQAGIPEFSTHTPRHLCLTDLARADWDIHEIARFAGHRSTQTTLLYIHLSGRELAEKLASGMDHIHTWRIQILGDTTP